MAHPERDENVTLEMTERFVEAYRAAGGRVELAVFAGVGHSFANFGGRDAVRCIEQMRAFIAAELAARYSTSELGRGLKISMGRASGSGSPSQP